MQGENLLRLGQLTCKFDTCKLLRMETTTMPTNTLPFRTYSENIRMAAKQKGLNIREISTRTGYSYEHIRTIWMGNTTKRSAKFTVGDECNEILCKLLDLPEKPMFELAEREKFARKNGYAPMQLVDPLGQELSEIWTGLTDEQKQMIVQMGQSFAMNMANVRA